MLATGCGTTSRKCMKPWTTIRIRPTRRYKIIADDNFQEKRSDAQSYKDRVNEVWGRVQRMTEAIRAGNHPVIAYMREAGQKAHQAYQDSHSSLCTVREQPVKNNKADCISADQCWVIELKP